MGPRCGHSPRRKPHFRPRSDSYQVCQSEGRCLITLDVEFGNPLLFKPSEHRGIAVLRLPSRASPEILREALQTLAAGLAQNPIDGLLWIIQRGRIREYQEEGRKDF